MPSDDFSCIHTYPLWQDSGSFRSIPAHISFNCRHLAFFVACTSLLQTEVTPFWLHHVHAVATDTFCARAVYVNLTSVGELTGSDMQLTFVFVRPSRLLQRPLFRLSYFLYSADKL
ncbi:unnamed protein product [Ixodes pacificus]